MKHPSNLQIAMSKSSGLAEGTKGQGEDPPPPPDFGRYAKPIPIKGTDYTHHIITYPPGF